MIGNFSKKSYPDHWVYKVLKEHKAILLSCFFFPDPAEMFNLESSNFDDEDVRQTIMKGLSNNFLFLSNDTGEKIFPDPNIINCCKYEEPSQRIGKTPAVYLNLINLDNQR